jgi:hypothetical protein
VFPVPLHQKRLDFLIYFACLLTCMGRSDPARLMKRVDCDVLNNGRYRSRINETPTSTFKKFTSFVVSNVKYQLPSCDAGGLTDFA